MTWLYPSRQSGFEIFDNPSDTTVEIVLHELEFFLLAGLSQWMRLGCSIPQCRLGHEFGSCAFSLED